MNPQPWQPPRTSTSSVTCDLHPDELFAGSFCPLCLCERLATLDIPPLSPPSTKKQSKAPVRFFPELRRAKSFSASKGELPFSGTIFEPQRHSCDVRGRSNLWTLFSQEDDVKKDAAVVGDIASSSASGGQVFESEAPVIVPAVVEEEVTILQAKTIKDHMDLDSNHRTTAKPPTGRDLKEIAGSFWTAASVLSKKLHSWRRKQKMKKRSNGSSRSARLPVEKPIGRQFRETQSEVADYGFGRRSCDTDPRFSLDIGRISLDDSRYSFDEPRASWDGYLIGKTIPRQPAMVALAEDPPPVARIDAHIPVEESPSLVIPVDDENLPGGSAQTRDYYSDSSRRRKSFERSNSLRKTASSVVAEIEEMEAVSKSKVSPPRNVEFVNVPKLVVGDREVREMNLNSNSLREYCSGPFDASFRDASFRDAANSVGGNGVRKCSMKKSKRWIKAFNIWGLINWRNVNKYGDDDRFSRANGVERSYSESWQDMRGRKFYGEDLGGFNRKIMRSNSSVSWRSSYNMDATFGSARKIGVEMNGHGHSKKKNEYMLERNQSSRFSPNHGNNNRSLFNFYMPPMRGSRGGGFGNAKPNNTHTFSRSGSRVY